MPNVTPSSVAAFADTAPVEGLTGAAPRATRLGDALRRDRAFQLAAVALLVVGLSAIGAPWLTPFDPTQQFELTTLQLRSPSLQHWFGTDPFARDVFSRVLFGARVSLAIAFLAVALTLLIGVVYGAIAGYVGGIADTIMMRTIDALLSIPRVLLLLGVLSLWGQLSVLPLVLLIGDREFVAASRALGAAGPRTLVRHVFPHLVSPVLVAATLGVGHVIIVEAGLSFLGVGVPQPQASWGSIIRDGREFIQIAWWLTVFPGLALIVTVLAVNVLSDRLRAAMNPRQLPAP
jgi:peptide/nickel transport system permease protein